MNNKLVSAGPAKIATLMLLLLTSCVHPRMENSQRLMQREDFPTAAQAAPEWVRDALKTINGLEYELERQ